jgi:hypothetical protein
MRQLAILLKRVDAFCARLNDGLAAVAFMLGVAVLTMATFRGPEFMPELTLPQFVLLASGAAF